jgi:excisionase family DNA binding protein
MKLVHFRDKEKPLRKETMQTHRKSTIQALEHAPEYLSVREAAKLMGVSERSIYGYIGEGKLRGARIGNIIAVNAGEVQRFGCIRKAPGRVRTTTPRWHVPPAQNCLFLTTITVRACAGQGALLDERLAEIRRDDRHRFPGTVGRYIGRNQLDPDEIEIVLIWRSVVMPPEQDREAALTALAAYLADVLDWETAAYKHSQVLLHA